MTMKKTEALTKEKRIIARYTIKTDNSYTNGQRRTTKECNLLKKTLKGHVSDKKGTNP